MARYKRSRTTAENRSETSRRRFARNHTGFVDPFPEVGGTLPEKIVYARLTLMRIPFMVQTLFNVNIPDIQINKDYRPDFILPDAKIIIEVQGSYWHSQPGAIESDSYKYALYTAMGYKVLIWWDYEIESNLDALFRRDLNIWNYRRGGRIIDPKRQVYRDDLKGLRTMNTKYKRKDYKKYVGAGKKSVRKVKSSYATR